MLRKDGAPGSAVRPVEETLEPLFLRSFYLTPPYPGPTWYDTTRVVETRHWVYEGFGPPAGSALGSVTEFPNWSRYPV